MIKDHNARPSVLVIGIGAELRGDDAAGLIALRLLRTMDPLEGVGFLECADDGLNLIHAWEGVDVVILIDAVSAGLPPGTITTIDVRDCTASLSKLQSSSHHIGLAETIELGRALHALPPVLILYGVQWGDTHPGETLSPAVVPAIDRIVASVRADLHHWRTAIRSGANPGPHETIPSFPESNERGFPEDPRYIHG